MVYIERSLITQIDTKDPLVLYSTDMVASLKAKLAEMYVGKCFKSCYITEILDIENSSPPVMEAMRNGGSARIAIRFRIRGIIYDMYEVIPDAKIVEIIEDGKMLLRSSYAAIMIAADSRLQNYRVGMTVPIRVIEARCIPYHDRVAVSGIPFVPITEPHDPFDVNLTDEDHAACATSLARLSDMQKRFTACPHHKEWAALLDGKHEVPEGFKFVDFTKVLGRGRITRSDWSPLMDTTVAWRDVKDESKIKNSATVLRGYIAAATKQLELACTVAEHYDWDSEKTAPWVALYRSEK